MVVERLGRLHTIESPGWFIAIPVIDRIAYRVSRERNVCCVGHGDSLWLSPLPPTY